MSKKKASAKGKKSRAQKQASTPPPAAPITAASSAPESTSRQSAAPASASKQPLREPKEKLDQKIEKLHEKIQEKTEAARAGFASDPSIDDTSIPPVVEDEFFAKGEEPHRISHAGASGAFEPIHHDTRGSHRKLTPEAHARRGELAKYVKAIVGVAAAILVIGFVKITFFKGHKEAPVAANLTSAAQPIVQPAQTAPAQTAQIQPAQNPAMFAPDPTPAPQATDTKPEEKVEPVAAAADAGKVEEVKPEEKPEAKPTRTAAQEKAAAQAALEGGNAAGAIAAGQRSVALDPTDAEAWLILGGAYQMQNRNGEAKAAFSSCVKQAKRGPVGECTQMLQ